MKFKVDAGYNDTWLMEGTTTSPATALGTPTVTLGPNASFASGGAAVPDFLFENLYVTNP